jgi:hypothetical protein
MPQVCSDAYAPFDVARKRHQRTMEHFQSPRSFQSSEGWPALCARRPTAKHPDTIFSPCAGDQALTMTTICRIYCLHSMNGEKQSIFSETRASNDPPARYPFT